ncbi:hypothetical protein DXX93_09440 [Thalassotalea euphylliae]|uniref:START domain-containing protein n=1 Tax=Thalassotalea euphylliae TaxID=1655234 RepID=A0A3E0TQI1_9GAMM|nr:START domain-containing protein [Thalassotalea euphylliae]REL26774.1 hypothetical protein DXX93_09440 [Thalassotalea euphylliae]
MASKRFSLLFHHLHQIPLASILLLLSFSIMASEKPPVVVTADLPTEANWQQVRTSDTIRVSVAKVNNSRLAHIRAELTVRSSLSGFLLFLQDYTNIPNWLDNANHSELIKQVTPARNIFITYFDGVWPVKPRDMVIETQYQQQADLSIAIEVLDASDKAPANTDVIRVSVLQARWLIKPLEQTGQIKIQYKFSVDPNGAVPKWLVNQMTIRSVWQTMRNIEKQLPSSQWQQFHVDGIVEKSYHP